MLNNKTNSATTHIKIKAFTDPDLYSKLKKCALRPSTPPNSPNASYEAMGSIVKFYISSSSSSSSSKSASHEDIHMTTHRRYTL